MENIETAPTLHQIITDAAFYCKSRDINGVCCLLKERKDRSGWDGYVIALKYLHEVGYYYDITPIGIGSGIIETYFNNDNGTADMNEAMKWLGVCPKCNGELWSAFNWEFHNVNNCGNKKAVAPASEF